jgi:hypothetical protein
VKSREFLWDFARFNASGQEAARNLHDYQSGTPANIAAS